MFARREALRRSTGARTYYLIHRPAGSEKKSFLWIGDAATMSLADARERAREADRLRGQGSDPVEQRKREERTQRQRPTVAGLLSAFVDAGETDAGDIGATSLAFDTTPLWAEAP